MQIINFLKENKKNIFLVSINIAFWLVVLGIIFINFYASGLIFKYEENHDHHLPFFAYLGGMASNGIFPGIDFYSPHSIFIPLIFGAFFKIFGISQINLALVDGFLTFIGLFFIYKSARFVMPNLYAKLSILTLLLNHIGRDNPWFNDVIMVAIACGIYYFASYINDGKKYKLIIIGLVCFSLPFMRQQGLAISIIFIMLPMILHYLRAIEKETYKEMILNISATYFVCNILFFIFILVYKGFEGIEILFSSFYSLVNMSHPPLDYAGGSDLFKSFFDYTDLGIDWHGIFVKYFLYWIIIILPCIYFFYIPFSKFYRKEKITNIDSITFIVSLITLSTIVFNYPAIDNAKLKVQFGIAIWLFIEALRRCFYNEKHRKLSAIFILGVFLFINHSKINQFINQSMANLALITTQNPTYEKMPKDTPYAGMRFKADYASDLQNIIYKLSEYQSKNQNKKTIFDGELVEINNFLFLLFNNNKVALQHKFPYYYGGYNRKDFFKDIDSEFYKFINENKPIVIACTNTPKLENYEVLVHINTNCNILVPIESMN